MVDYQKFQHMVYKIECRRFTDYLGMMIDAISKKSQELEDSIKKLRAKITTEKEQASRQLTFRLNI